jgi:Ser/Thr protein kinase RdoA (MazF antagonist)
MIIQTNKDCNNKCKDCKGTCTFASDISEEYANDPDTYLIVGGEPTLQSGVFLTELSEHLIEKNPRCSVVLCTNGRALAYKKFAKMLILCGINNFAIYLASENEQENDMIFGVKGSYAQTMRGIQNLSKYPVSVNLITGKKTKKIKVEQNLQNKIRESLKSNFQLTTKMVAPIWSGNQNLNYRIETPQKNYFFKINCTKPEEKMKKIVELEASLVQYLKRKGFNSYELEKIKGKPWFKLGERICTLSTYVGGSLFEGSAAQIEQAVKKMVCLHQTMKEFGKIKLTLDKKIKAHIHKLKKAVQSSTIQEEKPTIAKNKEHILKIIRLVEGGLRRTTKKLKNIPIHGDYRAENLHFSDGEASILDFQNVVDGYASYDLAVFAISVFYITEEKDTLKKCIETFIREARPGEEEIAAIPLFMKAYQIYILDKRIREVRGMDEQVLQKMMSLIRKTDKITEN